MIWVEICALICVYVAVAFFRFFSEQSQYDKNCNCLHLSKAYFWLGLIGSVSFFCAGIFILILESFSLAFCFLLLSLLFALIFSAYYGYRICYDDEKILYRKYFEKYKVVYYKDIRSFSCGYDIEIKAEETNLTIPCYMANYEALLHTLIQNVPAKSKKNIQKKPRVRRFRDSVYRPGEFIFAYILIYVVITGLWIVLIYDMTIFKPEHTFELCGVVFITLLNVLIPPVSFMSAKKAHASKFWKNIAKVLFRAGYLKD